MAPTNTAPGSAGQNGALEVTNLRGQSAIDWIKRYRATAGCTLREAKDAFDAGRPMPASRAEAEEALERDARRQALIAAAPQMLEALLNARGLIDTPVARRKHQNDPFYEDVVTGLRAAIAAATGEEG